MLIYVDLFPITPDIYVGYFRCLENGIGCDSIPGFRTVKQRDPLKWAIEEESPEFDFCNLPDGWSDDDEDEYTPNDEVYVFELNDEDEDNNEDDDEDEDETSDEDDDSLSGPSRVKIN